MEQASLVQRFRAVETADLSQDWSLARHFELIGPPQVAIADLRDRQALTKMEHTELETNPSACVDIEVDPTLKARPLALFVE